jgi:hypothetical protein
MVVELTRAMKTPAIRRRCADDMPGTDASFMKPSIKKVASLKTMRVATLFTGTAACAIALAPGAMAAVQSGGGNIQGPSPCGPVPHWLHFRNGGDTYCFGHVGWETVASLGVSRMCGGNNSGFYYGYYKNANGDYETYSAGFGAGTTYVNVPHAPNHLTQVSIFGWSGNDTCSA